jgi:myo-inositol-1-phosphate synthase
MSSKPIVQEKVIRTDTRVPKVGVMLVGLGGNNGSTFTAGVIANKKNLSWATKNGESKANMFGSFTQSATTHVGFKFDESSGNLKDVFKPIKDLLPMVNPIDFDVCGWDISDLNLYEAAKRAHVLEPSLIEQLKDDLQKI